MLILSFAVSLGTLAMLWLMGNKSIWGPIVGLLNQLLWLWYVIGTKQWGLLLAVLAVFVVHSRNLLLWRKR